MTYYVSSGTLNSTNSTHSVMTDCGAYWYVDIMQARADVCAVCVQNSVILLW